MSGQFGTKMPENWLRDRRYQWNLKLKILVFFQLDMLYIPGPSSSGAKWFCYRVSIHHPLGFNWHPLEGAGIYVYIYDHIYIYNYLTVDFPAMCDY